MFDGFHAKNFNVIVCGIIEDICPNGSCPDCTRCVYKLKKLFEDVINENHITTP